MSENNIEGKVTIVTGGNNGIGLETARGLAKRGARVVLACRNAERGQAAVEDITSSTANNDVVFKPLDLASFKSIRSFADDIINSEKSLDILVLNAGLIPGNVRTETEDGIESTFGVNHLGHFLLVNLLLEKVKASQPSRIVIVSSEAHKNGKLDFDNLQQTKGSFQQWYQYGMSKTCNILMGVHLASMLKDTGVTAYSLHPGVVNTGLFQKSIDSSEGCCSKGCFSCCLTCFSCCLVSPQKGAATSLYCALNTKVGEHSGRYYSDCKEKTAKSYAMDLETAQKLWTVSAEMCGL